MVNRRFLRIQLVLVFFLISFLAACQAVPPTTGVHSTQKPASTVPPVQPSPLLPPELAPTLTPLPSIQSKVITVGDINKVEAIAQFGKGTITNSIVFSPSGKLFAIPASTGVFLYDSQSFEEVAVLKTKSLALNISFSPDGQLLATSGSTNSIQLWKLSDATLVDEINLSALYSLSIYQIGFSPDGKMLAFAYGPDNFVEIWRVQNQALIQKYSGSWFSFSPDSKYLATTEFGGEDINQRPIHLFELSNGKELNTWRGVKGLFTSGDQLAIQKNESVQILNVVSNTALTPIEGSQAVITTDGQNLAIFQGRTIEVYDLPRGRVLQTLTGQYGSVEELQFSTDQQYLSGLVSSGPVGCCGGGPDKLIVWEVGSGTIQLELDLNQYSRRATFSPDGQYLVLSDSDRIDFLLLSSGKIIHTIEGFTNTVLGIKFTPDSQKLAASYYGLRSVLIWDLTAGEIEKVFMDPQNSNLGTPSTLVISPDGKILALNGNFWDLAAGSPIPDIERKLFENKPIPSSVAFHPIQNSLAAGFSDGSIRFWNLSDNILQHDLFRLNGEVINLSFSADGKMISVVQAYPSFSVQVLKFDENYPQILTLQSEYYRQAIFSPDNQNLAVLFASREKDYEATPPGRVGIWNLAGGKRILELDADNVMRIAYSPDGRLIAAGLFDQGAVKIWDAVNGKLLSTLNGHIGHVIDVAFSPDGTRLASASDDGTIIIWGIPAD